MNETVKIAVSLPRRLLEAVDRRRAAESTSRSKFFRDAVEEKLARDASDGALRRYTAGYQDDPETPEEVEAARRAAASLLAGEPWE